MPQQRDPRHPILPDAWKYEVVEFHWARGDDGERYVDLVLRHTESDGERRLRFRRPVEVRFADCGYTSGLFIDDISGRGLQGLHVRVGNYENDATPVELMAWDVVDITDETAPE
jgi:hypothetical protein